MRYWVRVNKESLGPFTPEQIRQHPKITDDTLVYPETAKSGAAWKRLREVPELLRASGPPLSAPPPPPPPATDSSTPMAPSRLVKCPDCGRAVSQEAPNCPSCGGPIPIRTSWKRIGIALAIVFGLPLLFLMVAALLTPSPNDPIAPTAHVQGGLSQPEDQERMARIQKVEAERKAAWERAEQAAKKFRGTPIDYSTFFAKAKGTGLQLGKRYTFQATVTHDFCLYDTSGNHDHLLCADSQIEENNSERLEQFLKGPDRQILTVTAAMLEGSLGARVVILRLE